MLKIKVTILIIDALFLSVDQQASTEYRQISHSVPHLACRLTDRQGPQSV